MARFGGKDATAKGAWEQNLVLRWRVRARMLNVLWLATALALAGGCVTVPAKDAGINAGSTNSALNPNGTKFSRFWKRQSQKFESLAKKPAPKTINTAPPNAEFFLAIAVAQEQDGNAAKAEEFYEKALASDPKSLEALTAYAHFEDRRRHLTAATKLYKRALARYPEEASVYNDLALCYQRRGLLDESVAMLTKATQLQPERPLYHNNLATVLVDSDRADEALTQLSAVNPPAVAHYNLGCLLHRKGQDSLAVEQFQRAIIYDPKMEAAQQWLAKLGPQPPAEVPEQQIAQRQRSLQPVQVEAGPAADPPAARVSDSPVPVTVRPATPQAAARAIPVQAVSRQTVRQQPAVASVDEVAPPTQGVHELQPADPPADEPVAAGAWAADPPVPTGARPATELLPGTATATDAVFSPPPDAANTVDTAAAAQQLPAESLATQQPPAPPPAAEPPPAQAFATQQPASPPPPTEQLPDESLAAQQRPGTPRATASLFSPPPAIEPLPDAAAANSLFSPPPATEPLPAETSAAAPQNHASGARLQYPHYSGHTDSPDGFEMLPAAPLPDAAPAEQPVPPAPPARPARPMSQPDQIEPLPATVPADEPANGSFIEPAI